MLDRVLIIIISMADTHTKAACRTCFPPYMLNVMHLRWQLRDRLCMHLHLPAQSTP